jgi:hypothetical protein
MNGASLPVGRCKVLGRPTPSLRARRVYELERRDIKQKQIPPVLPFSPAPVLVWQRLSL